jgi:uncharacterized cupredoxin-like copper-binding protein
MVRLARFVLLTGCLLTAALAMACGGSSKSSNSASSSGAAAAATTAPTAAAAAVQQVSVKDMENGDAYTFDPNQITVKAGKVVVHYTNPATSARNHTFELKNLDGSGDIVKSDQIAPGGTIDFEFTVTAPGKYDFLCFNRGHADRGQTGTLTVTGPLG